MVEDLGWTTCPVVIDCLTLDEFVSITPYTVRRIGFGNLFWILCVPHLLCEFKFLYRCLFGERWFQRRHDAIDQSSQ